MKILMLVNWKIEYCNEAPCDKQPPDYYLKDGSPYWFFRYFKERPEVDVIDISSFKWIENFEKNKLRFYVIQSLKAIPKLNKYDLILSHGMQSGVVVSLWRKFFNIKAKHIVFDIGSFNSAAESGKALKLMQYASKSIDGIIYHTSSQIEYYKKFFPWIVDKSKFIRFGTDFEFFDNDLENLRQTDEDYIICVGYSKRDWDTLVSAYRNLNTKVKMKMIGHKDEKYNDVEGLEQLSFIPIKELIQEINNSRFCVLPLESFNYSFGQMTLMQQMALGKCVIAADVPSLRDYIEDGKTAVLYQAKNVQDLQLKLEKLIDNEDLAKEIGKRGREFILEECNEITMALEIESFLKERSC